MSKKTLRLLACILLLSLLGTMAWAWEKPIRLRFPKGKTATSVRGVVGKYGKVEYLVGGKKSQTLTTSVASGCASVSLDVLLAETGASLTDEAAPKEFSNTLPSDGDYLIRVQNSDAPDCNFTLKVDIE